MLPQGEPGESGPPGAQGIQGILGNAGIQGSPGLRGAPGDPGVPGREVHHHVLEVSSNWSSFESGEIKTVILACFMYLCRVNEVKGGGMDHLELLDLEGKQDLK